ncbi:RNA polymerase sigma-70 factor (ECF subfamily) [Melghiribacillus thermohalophilus]|uniref:RNA polymerase sigma-70 factor (ECF subfamily) n=1 Tax=Melghiribacillus thermohalophilus TaxID=1324956 RepID=A0A4R3NGG8_9BACI|nr:RNA polymerase sigma factor [Melghiribacillus thermohalophilus]TCT26383.1 RNA polymerase sigma-70 factor (ECF subfamily) [Melghiribacillus thermohalophilus]
MNDIEFGEKLYHQLEQVKKYLMKMGASLQDAEDVIQDTAYKFLTYIDSVDIENVESWLFRVSVNRYYDLCRKKTRRKDVLVTFDFLQLLRDDETPEKVALQNELKDDISYLLNKLKPKFAEFLLLKYSTGLKLDEIAFLYEMKVNSVKTILHRARKQFIKEYRRLQDEREE